MWRANCELVRSWESYASGRFAHGRRALLLAIALIIMMTMFAACGGGGTSGNPQPSATLSGNWQFTMAPLSDGNQNDPTFGPGLMGGFLLQNNDGSATGQAVYSLTSSAANSLPCNSGSATLTDYKIDGTTVSLTYMAGTPTNNITFMLTGTLSSTPNGPVINPGSYTTTVVTPTGSTACGYAETTGLSWSATSVPPLTGTIQGSFHSTGGAAGLNNQDFLVSGSLTEGDNIGASNATVTGTLSFVDPTTNLSVYPCFSYASVNGQISGNSVILQIIGTNGSTVGQIGEPAVLLGSTGIHSVTFDSVQGGYVLHGPEPSYMVGTTACGGSVGSTVTAGDYGNICLALNSASACQQPVTLSPYVINFPAQLMGSAATTQTITLANNANATLNGLTLNFSNNSDNTFVGQSDFNGLPSFAETDACGVGGAPSKGQPFYLNSGQSCSVIVSFSPQESCPWLPFGSPAAITGAAPQYCPFPQTATVTVNSPTSADSDKAFAVPITGVGLSAIQPSTPELDFSAEEQFNPPEASQPQTLSFTNYGANSVQILGSAPCLNPPQNRPIKLPRPLAIGSPVAGLQVVAYYSPFAGNLAADNTTITYNCDSDPGTFLPNFQISSDTCTGTDLAPQASCSLEITYVPQPKTNIGSSGLDAFLELNTVQCTSAVTSDCEIDSGRFPVELKSDGPSPLRMTPSAGLDFGIQKKGTTSNPQTVTLTNDGTLTNPLTVTFVGTILVSGNYSIPSGGDSCPAGLAPGDSCTVSVTFTPGSVGFASGQLTIDYTQETSSGVVTTGYPQFVYLRGTGQ